MLTVQFMAGGFSAAFVLGFYIGYQILVFKKSVEYSTSG